MLELKKLLLYGNHDNHLLTKCFCQFLKNVVKKHPIQMLAATTIFNFKTLNFVREKIYSC